MFRKKTNEFREDYIKLVMELLDGRERNFVLHMFY